MADDAYANNIAELRWIARGIFPDNAPPPKLTFPESNSPAVPTPTIDSDNPITNLLAAASPLPQTVAPNVEQSTPIKLNWYKRELVTIIDGGTKKVTSVDYGMAWKDYTNPKGAPSTTHELTADMHNGFDPDFIYVSGMVVNMIARVSKLDPSRQQVFSFPKDSRQKTAQPHTLRFANIQSKEEYGMLWVGLENQGRIVKLNMAKLLQEHGSMEAQDDGQGISKTPIELKEEDFEAIRDVRLHGDGVPTPINTRPHGFCFDADYKHIWFTGKLTNTVGRIAVQGTDAEIKQSIQHFELPTLGSVPIYVALGPDKNIWGTCLTSSIIFRVTTGTHPVVDELSITRLAHDRRPIAIKPDPRPNMPFMWFSTESGHSICRLDTNAFQNNITGDATDNKNLCVCSSGCKSMFQGNENVHEIITEFPIPKVNRKMMLGGLAMSEDGAVWAQSYVSPADNPEFLPDYILKIEINEHDPTSTHDDKRQIVNMTGVPVDYYELPTKNTILHRITMVPEKNGGESVWFTELRSDRVGTITIEPTD